MKITLQQARDLGIYAPLKAIGRKKNSAEKSGKAALFLACCKAYGLPEPEPEQEFHPTRHWRFDWLWRQGKVALEIEGGAFMGKKCPTCGLRPGGGHNRGNVFLDNMDKYNEASLLGYLLLRATWDQVNSGEAFALVKRALEARAVK